jgi:DNA-directed RNA polymerase specialized sigma24 family protein
MNTSATPPRPPEAPEPVDVPGPASEVPGHVDADVEERFTAFVLEIEPRLRRAFVAAYGSYRGREATAEALAYAWEHWSRLAEVHNVPGYLFRVGQSRTRRKRTALTFTPDDQPDPVFEPDLIPALRALTLRQRTAVVLVHGFGWTLHEVAQLTGTKVTTVQNHLERGLAKLRHRLEGTNT